MSIATWACHCRNYGTKVIVPQPIIKALPIVLDSKDGAVRIEAKVLAVRDLEPIMAAPHSAAQMKEPAAQRSMKSAAQNMRYTTQTLAATLDGRNMAASPIRALGLCDAGDCM